MNNKDKFLHNLYIARLEHSKWISQIRMLTSDTIDNAESSPVSFFETKFYLWFKESASYLLFNENTPSFKKIQLLMHHFDAEYSLIYNISIKNRGKTFFGKLKPMTTEEKDAALRYFKAIEIITEKLDILLEHSEKEIKGIKESSFEFMDNINLVIEKKEVKEENPKEDNSTYSGARGAFQN